MYIRKQPKAPAAVAKAPVVDTPAPVTPAAPAPVAPVASAAPVVSPTDPVQLAAPKPSERVEHLPIAQEPREGTAAIEVAAIMRAKEIAASDKAR